MSSPSSHGIIFKASLCNSETSTTHELYESMPLGQRVLQDTEKNKKKRIFLSDCIKVVSAVKLAKDYDNFRIQKKNKECIDTT